MKFCRLLIFALLLFTSCQKVIDVKLNNTAPQYVIQGTITDGPPPYYVTISRTTDFSADNSFEQVSGAQVRVLDSSSGQSETLTEVSPGRYQSSVLAGVYGHTYHLSVNTNGQSFMATSVMPLQAVDIDSLYASTPIGGGSKIFVTAVFRDPPGKGNFYLFRQWVNGQQVKSNTIRKDDVADGQTFSVQLRYLTDPDFGNPVIQKGDSVRVELDCVNAQVYDYYRTLQAVTGASNTSTPTNPLTNITGGALGVFNTCTSRTKSVIVNF